MKISKGNVQKLSKKILAGTIAFTFLTTKIIGYKVVKHIKYSHAKLGYIQTENTDISVSNDYAIVPEKTELCSNNYKYNYKKNKDDGLIVMGKRKVLKKYF